MLAKVKSVDFFIVSEAHADIHNRLELWARWVKPRKAGWAVSPMFRHYRSHAWQWETPEVRAPINTLDAVEIEKAVAQLPEKHKHAIRWHYVFKTGPSAMARELGVSKEGLADLVRVGRTMLNNRLHNT